MKKTSGGYRAMEFEGVVAGEASDDYLSRKLYSLEGQGGIWRRVAWHRSEDTECVLAFFDGGLIALVPQREVAKELAEAGFVDANGSHFTAAASELVEKLKGMKAILDEVPEELFKPDHVALCATQDRSQAASTIEASSDITEEQEGPQSLPVASGDIPTQKLLPMGDEDGSSTQEGTPGTHPTQGTATEGTGTSTLGTNSTQASQGTAEAPRKGRRNRGG